MTRSKWNNDDNGMNIKNDMLLLINSRTVMNICILDHDSRIFLTVFLTIYPI
jgi:hypothetical protein